MGINIRLSPKHITATKIYFIKFILVEKVGIEPTSKALFTSLHTTIL